MATQRERNEDQDDYNSSNGNTSNEEDTPRDQDVVFSTSDSDTALIRRMSSLTYVDRLYQYNFGEETQQSESDQHSDDEVVVKRPKTEERRLPRVQSRDWETYSESIKYIPGQTKFDTNGRSVEIIIEQIPTPPTPPPKGLIEEWIIKSLIDEPWFTTRVKKIQIGKWTSCTHEKGRKVLKRMIETLVNHKARLSNVRDFEIGSPNVRAADLMLCDVSKLLEFENLTRLKIRGSKGLTIDNPRDCYLQSLIVEGTGCMSKAFLRGLAECNWHNLSALELWLGSNEESYQKPWACDDLDYLFQHLPQQLQFLSLRNSTDTNEIVERLVGQPDLTQHLTTLDLSYGTLDDDGAHALSERITDFESLTELMINHHFVSADILNYHLRENLFIIATPADTSYWGTDGEAHKPRFL